MSLWRSAHAAVTPQKLLCDPSLCALMTGMRPLPLLSGPPSLPAGQRKRWLMLAWDALPSAPAYVPNHGCWFQLAQSHAPILTSLIQGLCLCLHFFPSLRVASAAPSASRVKLFGVCVAPGNGRSLVWVSQDISAAACQVSLVIRRRCKRGRGGGWANDVKATPDNQSEQWLVLMAGGCLVLGWLMLAWASIQSPAMWTPLCKHCHCGESLSSLKPRSVASFVICSRDQKEGGEGSQDWGSHV